MCSRSSETVITNCLRGIDVLLIYNDDKQRQYTVLETVYSPGGERLVVELYSVYCYYSKLFIVAAIDNLSSLLLLLPNLSIYRVL